MAMYIRVKRRKTTYFVQCNPWDDVRDIKVKLQALSDNPVHNQRLILLDSRHILDDYKTLSQQHVENNSTVAMTLRKSNGEWEEIEIDKADGDDSDSS